MKTFTIHQNDSGQRLDRFLQKLMPELTTGMLYKSLRKKRVKVNGKRITDGSLRLNTGDTLELYINDEYFVTEALIPPTAPSFGPLDVVYEDDHILVMYKPSGLLSQGTPEQDSLEARMRRYLMEKEVGQPKQDALFQPSLCHRIDRNTSGLVLGAKDAESLRILNEKIKGKEIRKFYLCETQGIPKPQAGEITGYVTKNERTRTMLFSKEPTPKGMACKTLYRVLSVKENTAVVEAELLTGRTHQIRASFAALGCPLVGDVKYGAKKDNRQDFQHLISYRLVFAFTSPAGCLDYLKDKEVQL